MAGAGKNICHKDFLQLNMTAGEFSNLKMTVISLNELIEHSLGVKGHVGMRLCDTILDLFKYILVPRWQQSSSRSLAEADSPTPGRSGSDPPQWVWGGLWQAEKTTLETTTTLYHCGGCAVSPE